MVVHWKEGPQSSLGDTQELCFISGISLCFRRMHCLLLGFITLGSHEQFRKGRQKTED